MFCMSLDRHLGFDVLGDVPACIAGTIGIVDWDWYVDLAGLEVVLLDELQLMALLMQPLSRRPLVLRVFVPVTGFKTMSTRKLFFELSWAVNNNRWVTELVKSFSGIFPSKPKLGEKFVGHFCTLVFMNPYRKGGAGGVSFRASQTTRSVQSTLKGRIHR